MKGNQKITIALVGMVAYAATCQPWVMQKMEVTEKLFLVL